MIAASVFAAVVAVLSWWPVKNLFSESQVMNGSFDKLHLVNTYGAFGRVGRSATRSSSKERQIRSLSVFRVARV